MDEWSDGAGYESYLGRGSRAIAREFLRWLEVAPGSAWLDFGCGTGALSQTWAELGSLPGDTIPCMRAGIESFERGVWFQESGQEPPAGADGGLEA